MEREFNAKPEGILNMSDPRREKNKNFIVSYIVPWHSKDASIQNVSMMLQGGVCWCHGANTKLCCNDAKLFEESSKKWIVSRCTHYARKIGEYTMHGGNIQEQTCSYNERGQKCTNRARNGGVCYDHYIESIICY